MVSALEAEADEDETGHDEGGGDPDGEEAGFRVEVLLGVVPDVEAGEVVVEPVAGDFAQDGGHNGGEVEVAWRSSIRTTYV